MIKVIDPLKYFLGSKKIGNPSLVLVRSMNEISPSKFICSFLYDSINPNLFLAFNFKNRIFQL